MKRRRWQPTESTEDGLVVEIRGGCVLIDSEEAEFLSRFSWHVSSDGYALTTLVTGLRRYKVIKMHDLLCCGHDCPTVDHINGNRLDNRKSNLRPATWKQQQMNVAPMRDKRHSKYKGVSKQHTKGSHKERWTARIMVQGRRMLLGWYKTELEAAAAYDLAAEHYFEDFARLNGVVRCDEGMQGILQPTNR